MLRRTFLAVTLSSLFLVACSGGQSSSEPAKASAPAATLDLNKTYIVATDASYAPMEYMENNQVVGFSHDILDAAAKSQKVKLCPCQQRR